MGMYGMLPVCQGQVDRFSARLPVISSIATEKTSTADGQQMVRDVVTFMCGVQTPLAGTSCPVLAGCQPDRRDTHVPGRGCPQ